MEEGHGALCGCGSESLRCGRPAAASPPDFAPGTTLLGAFEGKSTSVGRGVASRLQRERTALGRAQVLPQGGRRRAKGSPEGEEEPEGRSDSGTRYM